jgi:hypothetical protein
MSLVPLGIDREWYVYLYKNINIRKPFLNQFFIHRYAQRHLRLQLTFLTHLKLLKTARLEIN